MVRVVRLEGVRTVVGESPVWDPTTNSVWLIDILGRAVIRIDSHGLSNRWPTSAQVGAVAPLPNGEVAVALAHGFTILDPVSGRFSAVVDASCAPGTVISEGKVDRQGRFVVASSDAGFSRPVGAIHRWNRDGSVSQLDDGLTLGNSVCWNLDGTTFFVADSIRKEIFAYDYSSEDDAPLRNRRVFCSFENEQGFPDGATVDSEDHLWVVLHNSPWLVRIAPDGHEVSRFELPTTNITSVAFGGSELDVLYATSLDPTQIPGVDVDDGQAHEESGYVYRIEGIGFTGVAETPLWRPQAESDAVHIDRVEDR